MSTNIQSIIVHGSTDTIVDIECHLSNNLPTIVIVGLANKAVGEARERIRGAFATSKIYLPRKRITINLAPADIPKAESGFDLAIAVAILHADGQLSAATSQHAAYIGELGLDGQTRAVRGIIGKILAGRAQGFTTFYIPAANLAQANLVPNVTIVPVDNLGNLAQYLANGTGLTARKTGVGDQRVVSHRRKDDIQLSEIAGQEQAKRALIIAAAGGHNMFLSGAPGTGKSMLAKALSSLLPALSREEMLEVSHLHSLAGTNYGAIVSERPFRSPHHTASSSAIIGGGFQMRPGEISLAHRGVLLMDELPEFERDTLEALRQPLEDRVINIARSRDSLTYAANFILVATANPCPCGYYGTGGNCHCLPSQILHYQHKLSGPILDRIDIYSQAQDVEHAKLLTAKPAATSDHAIRMQIQQARQRQARRFKSGVKLNSDMTNNEIKRYGRLEPAATTILNEAAKKVSLSARAYMRTVRVARTIADLEGSVSITSDHISEALAYRYHQSTP